MEQELRRMFEMKETEMTVPSTLSPELRNRVGRQRMVMGGLVAAAAFALVIGGFAGARSLSNDAAPIPPADQTEEKDQTVVDFPALTNTFVSPINGFSIKHPDGVALTPAKLYDEFDVVKTGLGAVFKGVSTESLGDRSIDERVDERLSDDYVSPGGCGVPRSQQAKIRIDGLWGRIAECPNRIEATVVAGGQLYLFTLSHDRSDAKAVFDAFVATIDLTPETAVDFPTEAITATFVSPTYGYSFGYLDRGGLAPATELWDPVNRPPLDDIDFDDQFDAVETGYDAYFESASTQIPDGVSIDEWVDEYVSGRRGPCGVPRSQQAEITIDGQSGRECPNQTEATVVAGGRLYLFILSSGRDDARGWFDAWVDTIDLTPETAAVSR